MAPQRGARGADVAAQHALPVAGRDGVEPLLHAGPDLVDDPLRDRVDERVLVREVVVERRPLDPELAREPARGERVRPLGVEQRDGGAHDLLAGLGSTGSGPRRTAAARSLLRDIDIEVALRALLRRRFKAATPGRGLYFDAETWGRDHFVAYPVPRELRRDPAATRRWPSGPSADLATIHDAPEDWLPGMTDAQKKDRLAAITYLRYLTEHVQRAPRRAQVLQTVPNGNWGYGADAVGALDASVEFPGFDGLGSTGSSPTAGSRRPAHKLWTSEDDYIYHFPEGNAGVARRSCAS